MIKQSLLDTLIGLEVDVAIKRCSRKGLKSMPIKNGTAHTALARPKTVILYHEDDKITCAAAGDGLELLKDI